MKKKNCPVCRLPMKRFEIDGKDTWKCMNLQAHAEAVRLLILAEQAEQARRQVPSEKSQSNLKKSRRWRGKK
jgi:hypothetical protein